jgi:hypothetical protein
VSAQLSVQSKEVILRLHGAKHIRLLPRVQWAEGLDDDTVR